MANVILRSRSALVRRTCFRLWISPLRSRTQQICDLRPATVIGVTDDAIGRAEDCLGEQVRHWRLFERVALYRRGVRKEVIYTILLSGLLCASGFAETTRTSSVDPFLDCISARSVLLDVGAWDRNGKQFREVPIWRSPDSRAFFFISGMTIDADGAPNAYHPDDTGLDELVNAGSSVHWDGIITDSDGNPLIQEDDDPFPGYYISCTSLEDETKDFADSARYVDATKIPYVVLPEDVAERGGARLGDFALVMNLNNGKSSFAIYADIGTLGEGSIALADALVLLCYKIDTCCYKSIAVQPL